MGPYLDLVPLEAPLQLVVLGITLLYAATGEITERIFFAHFSEKSSRGRGYSSGRLAGTGRTR